MKRYLYSFVRRYVSVFALGQNSIVGIDPMTDLLATELREIIPAGGARDVLASVSGSRRC